MNWIIPGTVLEAPREEAAHIEQQFNALFLGGGIALGQVAAMTGLEPYAIQNWVKRKFLPPPNKKRYDLNQFCRILTINSLKSELTMEQICSLLSYVNGMLDDDSDNLIDDAWLYFMFVRLAARMRELHRSEQIQALLDQELSTYTEPVPGAKSRIETALQIMLTGWLAARMRQETIKMINNKIKENVK